METGQYNERNVEEYLKTIRRTNYNNHAVLLMGGRGPPDDPSYAEAERRYDEERRREVEQKAEQAVQETAETETEWWRCFGDRCKVDHSKPRAAVTMDGEGGDFKLIDIEEDGGSSADFISPKLVKELHLRTQQVEITAMATYKTMTGTFEVTRKVKLSLIGRSRKRLSREFLVAPSTCPFAGILAGRPFIDEIGYPHTLFPDKQEAECNVIRQKKMTEAEKMSREHARAENERKAAEVDALKKQKTQGHEEESSGKASGQKGRGLK